MSLAYLLWFFLGTFGAHRFYLKRTGSGWVQFSVHVGGWLLIALALWRVGQGSYVETAQSGAYMMRMSWSAALGGGILAWMGWALLARSEEHTSELQSLMRISYAVFCLKKKKYSNG